MALSLGRVLLSYSIQTQSAVPSDGNRVNQQPPSTTSDKLDLGSIQGGQVHQKRGSKTLLQTQVQGPSRRILQEHV